MWVNGYNTTAAYGLVNFGAANGCTAAGSCYGGWTQDNIVSMSWGKDRSGNAVYPIPEIYFATQARQWQQLAKVAIPKNQGVYTNGAFSAGLSQYGACQQNPKGAGCYSQRTKTPTNTPADAWTEFF